MNYKTFDIDLANNKTKLKTQYGRGISREMSSEDFVTRYIVYRILKYSYGNQMWLLNDCVIETEANCSDGDQYNLDTGHKICEIKSDLKYHRKMYDRYLKVAWILRRISNRVMDYVERHQSKIERLEKEYEKYVK